MLRFDHRIQPGPGTAVGGPLLRETVASAALRIDGPLTGAVLAPATHELHFTVRYALPEYVSFMWQHAAYLIRRRRVGRVAGWWLLSKSTSAAAMHFVTQGRSRHLYEFTIDEHGIIRANGNGVTLVPWSDVSAIRRYSCGFILVLARGTLPIPFRCLSSAQAAEMEAFAATVKAAARR